MKNIFEAAVTEEIIGRINHLTPETKALWGTMTVDQMLAHCCVTYEMLYEDKHPKPGAFMKLILRLLVKPTVVNEKPYKKLSRTAPAFQIQGARDFEAEKARLIDFMQRTQKLGGAYFDNRESHSFGSLKTQEWNNMFYKHLDHHLTQFGV
jgi:hypothetical protein